MSDLTLLDGGSWYYRAPDVLERVIGEEVVLAAPSSKDVAVLSRSAADVWRLLETPQMFVDLVKLLAREYERPVDGFAGDVEGVLRELMSRGLVAGVADGDD